MILILRREDKRMKMKKSVLIVAIASVSAVTIGYSAVINAHAARLHLGTALNNLFHHAVIKLGNNIVILFQTTLNALELQADNLPQHLVAQWIIRHHQQAAQQRRREHLQQRLAQGAA